MGNISVFELAVTKPISKMNPPYLKTPISISNSLLFTLALTMYFLDTVVLVENLARTICFFFRSKAVDKSARDADGGRVRPVHEEAADRCRTREEAASVSYWKGRSPYCPMATSNS